MTSSRLRTRAPTTSGRAVTTATAARSTGVQCPGRATTPTSPAVDHPETRRSASCHQGGRISAGLYQVWSLKMAWATLMPNEAVTSSPVSRIPAGRSSTTQLNTTARLSIPTISSRAGRLSWCRPSLRSTDAEIRRSRCQDRSRPLS